jgi:hypothetical protein
MRAPDRQRIPIPERDAILSVQRDEIYIVFEITTGEPEQLPVRVGHQQK